MTTPGEAIKALLASTITVSRLRDNLREYVSANLTPIADSATQVRVEVMVEEKEGSPPFQIEIDWENDPLSILFGHAADYEIGGLRYAMVAAIGGYQTWGSASLPKEIEKCLARFHYDDDFRCIGIDFFVEDKGQLHAAHPAVKYSG